MRLDRGAADRVHDGIDLIALAQGVERCERHADLGPQRAEDELPAPGRVNGLQNSVSSQELTVVRSSGGSSSSSSASSGSVGPVWPEATFTVEWMTGRSNAFAVLTVETAFSRSSS